MIRIIHDGDHGGDDFITSLLFMAYSEIFDLLGITTVTGNTGAFQASLNALKAVHLAQRKDVTVHAGAEKPWRIAYRLGDDAFGSDGIGGVEFISPRQEPHSRNAVVWIADQLEEAAAPVTICATGPLTNMAYLLTDYPHLKPKIGKLIIMGGGTDPSGNIKPFAEFNFYMDPDAADFVLKSTLHIVLHTLNTTQKAVYTKDRQAKVKSAITKETADKIDAVMRITEELEKKTFGAEGSFFHDLHVCACLAMSDNYETQLFRAEVLCDPHAQAGQLLLIPDETSTLSVVTNIKDIDRVFDFILEGLRKLMPLS